jgi:hypothetical protein
MIMSRIFVFVLLFCSNSCFAQIKVPINTDTCHQISASFCAKYGSIYLDTTPVELSTTFFDTLNVKSVIAYNSKNKINGMHAALPAAIIITRKKLLPLLPFEFIFATKLQQYIGYNINVVVNERPIKNTLNLKFEQGVITNIDIIKSEAMREPQAVTLLITTK